MDNAFEKKMSAPKLDEPEARGEILDMDDSYTPEEEKAVLRKIDMVILPFVSDRIAIGCLHGSQKSTDVLRLLPPVPRQAKFELRCCLWSHRRPQFDQLSVLLVQLYLLRRPIGR